MPAKADPVVQKQFHDDILQPLLKKAVSHKRRVFFFDAAHFVRGAFLAYLWCCVRGVVPTGSGRQRYSVLGALNAASRAFEPLYVPTIPSSAMKSMSRDARP